MPTDVGVGVRLLHLGRMNGLLADGHVESCGPDRIAELSFKENNDGPMVTGGWGRAWGKTWEWFPIA
jgi:prepilin-type processing-associated H-X9-DG protein